MICKPSYCTPEETFVTVRVALMQAGANVSGQCASGLTPLHVACRGQAVLVATLLLAAGIDASLRDARGCTALHYAAQTANWGLFSLLHAQPGCRPMSIDPKGRQQIPVSAGHQPSFRVCWTERCAS